jgi:hypothetical protein
VTTTRDGNDNDEGRRTWDKGLLSGIKHGRAQRKTLQLNTAYSPMSVPLPALPQKHSIDQHQPVPGQRFVSVRALHYLLNETISRSIKNTSKNTTTHDNHLKDIGTVNSPNTLSSINSIGYDVGFKTATTLLLSPNSTSQFHLSNDPLEAMKFICRDVWKGLFGKQMDNLRTNHTGTFVLVDNSPIPYTNCYYLPATGLEINNSTSAVASNEALADELHASLSISTSTDGADGINADADADIKPTLLRAPPFLEFHIGVIQGVLACLGVSVVAVSASADAQSTTNAAVFTVQTA